MPVIHCCQLKHAALHNAVQMSYGITFLVSGLINSTCVGISVYVVCVFGMLYVWCVNLYVVCVYGVCMWCVYLWHVYVVYVVCVLGVYVVCVCRERQAVHYRGCQVWHWLFGVSSCIVYQYMVCVCGVCVEVYVVCVCGVCRCVCGVCMWYVYVVCV